jgi:SAM-dependent methyltransferase
VESPNQSRFQDAYLTHSAPWVIGEPQPAIVDLERAGLIGGAVLDAGCGTGEHTVLLTRLGYDVLGVDFAPAAVEQARANAARHGVPARFEVADALSLDGLLGFDTVLDSALFHVFGDADRARYVRSLRGVCRPGATVHLLALSDAAPGFGPRISDAVIRAAFEGPDWALEALAPSRYRGIATSEQRLELGLPADGPADLLAWLARIRRC